jgi:hypothetical protein
VILALGVDVAIHAVEDRIEELLVLLEGLLEVLALGDVDGDPRQADDFALRPDDGRLDGQVAMPRAALLEEAGLPLLRALPGGKNLASCSWSRVAVSASKNSSAVCPPRP